MLLTGAAPCCRLTHLHQLACVGNFASDVIRMSQVQRTTVDSAGEESTQRHVVASRPRKGIITRMSDMGATEKRRTNLSSCIVILIAYTSIR